jgi:hypothetical protein
MTIGRRMTATATVPLRKVREATVDALETLEQHTAVINGQGFKLNGLGERVADVLVRLDAAEKRLAALESDAVGETVRLSRLSRG